MRIGGGAGGHKRVGRKKNEAKRISSSTAVETKRRVEKMKRANSRSSLPSKSRQMGKREKKEERRAKRLVGLVRVEGCVEAGKRRTILREGSDQGGHVKHR